jgi:hypothetical protein
VPLTVEALDHLVINVANVALSAARYQRTLGMQREEFDPGNGKIARTALRFGRRAACGATVKLRCARCGKF